MIKVFIYGGCTSRDAVDQYSHYGLELQHYIARQSLISAFKPADPSEFAIDPSERPFQKRMLEGDIKSSLPSTLRSQAGEVDLLVWDLMIERVGVAKVRSGGCVTRNGVKKAVGTDPLGGYYIFGTDEHFGQWEWALLKFSALLDRLGLKDRTVINATPWAVLNSIGDYPKSRSSMTPEWFNLNVQKYWDLAERQGFRVARIAQDDAIADPDHKWGPAYFHYTQDTYRAQLDAISKII